MWRFSERVHVYSTLRVSKGLWSCKVSKVGLSPQPLSVSLKIKTHMIPRPVPPARRLRDTPHAPTPPGPTLPRPSRAPPAHVRAPAHARCGMGMRDAAWGMAHMRHASRTRRTSYVTSRYLPVPLNNNMHTRILLKYTRQLPSAKCY